MTDAPSTLAGTRLAVSRFLSPEERRALDDAALPAQSVRPNTDLVGEGDRVDSLLVVAEGWACRYMTTGEGSRQIPALLLPGDVAALDALLFDRLDHGIRTITPAKVVAIPRDRARNLAALHPGIARTFLWLALLDTATLGRWALSLGRRSSRARLAHLLCELSVRLAPDAGDTASFAFPLTQEALADALGLTPVHVNRTMRWLRGEGMIATAGRTMTLPNLPALRRIGDFDPAYLHVAPPGA